MTFHNILPPLLDAAVMSFIGFILTLVIMVIPKTAEFLANAINQSRTLHRYWLIDRATREAVSYFKAHQDDISKQGVGLVDFACSRLMVQVPDLTREEAERAVQLFVSNMANDLKG